MILVEGKEGGEKIPTNSPFLLKELLTFRPQVSIYTFGFSLAFVYPFADPNRPLRIMTGLTIPQS